MKSFYLVVIALFFTLNTVSAQKKNPDPDFGVLVKELTKAAKKGQNMTQIICFPQVYWEIVFKDNPGVDQQLVKEIQNSFANYEMFLAFDVEIDVNGFNKNNIETFEILYQDQKLTPIKDYDPELRMFLNYVQPMFKQMMGQLGESIEVFVFDNQKKIFPSAFDNAKIEVIMNSQVFTYRLPISELVLKKTCPVDNEKLNGSWHFCPWHGVKLN